MLRLHSKALLFVTQSHKIPPEAPFVIVYALIVGLSLICAAIASIAGGFIFVIMFCTILNIGAVTLGVWALYTVVRWGKREVIVRRLDGSEEKNCVSPRKKEVCLLLSLRLIPAAPFFAVNVLAATSQVRF